MSTLVKCLETRPNDGDFDSTLVTPLVSTFASSVDKVYAYFNYVIHYPHYLTITHMIQQLLLGLGPVTHTTLWISNIILVQALVGALVMSLTLDETANLPFIEQTVVALKRVLLPIEASFE